MGLERVSLRGCTTMTAQLSPIFVLFLIKINYHTSLLFRSLVPKVNKLFLECGNSYLSGGKTKEIKGTYLP